MRLDDLLTHPDKIFWPDEGYTKRDLAKYYDTVFPKLKPYVEDRLLSLERCPNGMRGECFYQKAAPKGLPENTPTHRIRHKNRDVDYVVGGLKETQLALVNLGCIPIHVWASRASHPQTPDWMIFDLDPSSGKFSDAAKAGLLLKKELDALDITSYPKTSGSRGLHVFVPLRVGPEYDAVLTFAREVCENLAAEHPKELTMEIRIDARGGRVYLDAFRNTFGGTVVAPYSVRRREKASFSMPLDWSEVKPALDPSKFNLSNYAKALERPDPWKDFFKHRQSLPAAETSRKKTSAR
ncbi:MAG TPA: non-homologous end-joining DNA ligase [Bryobacteraceae bacterium]|nr:non-homologous end-joining DNA ligase [Bryobacteraceae bacterium]